MMIQNIRMIKAVVVLVCAIVKATNATQEDLSCPTWRNTNSNGTGCFCGPNLSGKVLCDEQSEEIYLLNCYCMSVDWTKNVSVVGPCIYNCFNLLTVRNNASMVAKSGPFYPLPRFKNDLEETCTSMNRKGLHCGECMEGFSAPVFSYNLECIRCTDTTVLFSLKLFLFIFLPPTLFYIFVLAFRLRVTSPKLASFVFACQMCGSPQIASVVTMYLKQFPKSSQVLAGIFVQFCSMWNLDFFRFSPLYVCISNLDTRSAMYLELVPAFYPLLLAFLIFLFLELQGRGCKFLVYLWSPFHLCFTKFRHGWNAHASTMDALATFYVLTCEKIGSTIMILLSVYQNKDISGSLSYWNYYQPSAHELRPTGYLFIIALILLTFFILIPFFSVLLYPVKKFRKHVLLKILFRSSRSVLALRAFMDSLQGDFKDGTEPNTRDLRYTAGLYLLLRLLVEIEYMIATHNMSILLIGITLTGFALFMLIAKPYKSKYKVYNIIDAIFLVDLSLFLIASNNFPLVSHERYYIIAYTIIIGLCALVLPAYLTVVILHLVLTSSYAQRLALCFQRLIFHQKSESQCLIEPARATSNIFRVSVDKDPSVTL